MKINHYVEFFYPYNPDVAISMEDTDIKLIEERNPLLFIDDSLSKIGFRFFDVEVDKNPLIKENRKNISPVYYYGKYLTQEEIDYIHNIMPYTLISSSMIKCDCGYLVTTLNDGDTVVDSLVNAKDKNLSLNYHC